MVEAWSLDESFKRMNEDSPTGIVETLQIPNDVVNVSTDIRVCDVYNDFYHSGKWQHMEPQLNLVAVQLEGKYKKYMWSMFQTYWEGKTGNNDTTK